MKKGIIALGLLASLSAYSKKAMCHRQAKASCTSCPKPK